METPISLSAAQTILAAAPAKGTRFLRPAWNESPLAASVSGEFNGKPFSLHANYGCHGTYGPTQEVEFLGFTVTLFDVPDTRIQVAKALRSNTNLGKTLLKLEKELGGLCKHVDAKEIGYEEAVKLGCRFFGPCDHAYKCPKCGEVFMVDSSD